MVSPAASEHFMASHWLAEMDAAARRAVLDVLDEHHAEPGSPLLEQGQPNDHIAFLIEGAAKVTRDGSRGLIESLTTLTAPSLFGLTSFFRPRPPDFTVKATTPVWFLTLDHHAHDVLRRADPHAAEQLALTALRVLSERLELLDRRITEDLAAHPDGDPKVTEWTDFRARFFDDSAI